jgi:hypothetical protein
MAYFIFLKSLRSLEEFRENPHVKIHPKSPPTNFQSLGTFKNQILFGKEFFLHFRPSRGPFFFNQPSPPPRWASASQPTHLTLLAQPTTHRWCPARLLPPTRENISPRAAFAPLRVWLTGGPHLSSPFSGATRAPLRTASSSSHHGCRALPRAPLFMADRYHSLISAIITITTPNSSSPFLISAAGRYRVHHLGAPPWPYRLASSPPWITAPPHLTLAPLSKHECRCHRALPPPSLPGCHTDA